MVLKGLSILSLNVRGLYSNLNELQVRFTDFDVLCFSETWLNSTYNDQMININGFEVFPLHQIRRYPAPYISKAGQKATPSNILQPFIPHCFPLQSPYINSRPFISSPHYFYSSPIRFRICPTPAQPTSILTRIVFPADHQPILNDQFYVEEMPEEIVIVVKLIYSDRTHST